VEIPDSRRSRRSANISDFEEGSNLGLKQDFSAITSWIELLERFVTAAPHPAESLGHHGLRLVTL
jgi:hypothetical protein